MKTIPHDLNEILIRWNEQKQIIQDADEREVPVALIALVLGQSEGFVVRACQPD